MRSMCLFSIDGVFEIGCLLVHLSRSLTIQPDMSRSVISCFKESEGPKDHNRSRGLRC